MLAAACQGGDSWEGSEHLQGWLRPLGSPCGEGWGEEFGGGAGDDRSHGQRGQGRQRSKRSRYPSEGGEKLSAEDQVNQKRKVIWSSSESLTNRVAADEMKDNPTSITLKYLQVF